MERFTPIGALVKAHGRSLAVACAIAACALMVLAPASAGGVQPVWTEIKWRFPIDQWGIGKTFRCAAKDCGREVDLYVRAKIGFCNCTTGVADDEELARVADFDLFGGRPVARAPGRVVKVQGMAGRSRVYAMSAGRDEMAVLAIALNHKCDAVVATVVVERGDPADLEAAALAFLASDRVARWLGAALGS